MVGYVWSLDMWNWEYSVSSISAHFWRKKCCLLRKCAQFACFITYKRVVKGFRQLSVKPCSVKFLKSLALKEVNFPIVLWLSWTNLRYLCRKYCFKRLKFTSFFLFGNSWRQRFWKASFSCNHIKTYRCVFKCLRIQKRFQMSPFRKRRPPFSIVAVWLRGENVSKTMRFQMKTH